MKKLFTLSYFVFLISYSLFSQSVGIGTNAPNASAQLDVSATNKGMLVPRVTNAQMLAIASPANGLLVYNTDSAAFAYRSGTVWVFLKGNANPSNFSWSTKGNAGTDPATNFIGTTDNQDLIFKRNNLRAGYIGGLNNINGRSNTSWGLEALDSITTGYENVANGSQALKSNQSGSLNTAIGNFALRFNTSGSNNVANGYSALSSNTNGGGNVAIGSGSLASLDGFYDGNTAVGNLSLNGKTSGSNNTVVGAYAGQSNITGSGNLFLGYFAGRFEAGSNKLYISNDQTNANNTLIYGEFDNKLLRSNGRIEINSDHTTTSGLQVKKNYATGTNIHVSAVYGENIIDDSYGIGVEGRGGRIGLQGTARGTGNIGGYIGVAGISDGTNSALNYGVQGQASGSSLSNKAIVGEASGSTGDKYGLQGSAAGAGGINYGVYGTASGGTTNYAGYFNGNVVIPNGKLGIGIATPHGEMQMPQTLVNRKIVLYEDADNDHQYSGFGVNAFIQRYQVAATTSSHVFYAGTSATTSTELMRITGNGEVGIGKEPLTSIADSRLQIKQKGNQNGIGITAANSANHWDFYVAPDAASDFWLYYNGIFKGGFDDVNGAYTQASDRRLKKDITAYQPVLNNVLQLQAYQYHYLDNQPTDRFSNGFMAQEVQKIFPDAVVENILKDGQTRLGINYQYFTVLAIKGLQEQQQQIRSQEERIAKLEAMVKTLADKK